MVLAFAGDSTITSFLPFAAAISRATLARRPGSAILAAGDASTKALPPLLPDRRVFPARGVARLPLPRLRTGESARLGRLCAGGRARVEPRPVAARSGSVPAPISPLHGEIGALLVPARPLH